MYGFSIGSGPKMKLLIVAFLAAVAAADKLDSTYLPPSSARFAGGNSFLAPPRTSYAAPASGPVPSGLYSTPSARTYSGQHYQQQGRGGAGFGGAPVAILRFDNDNNGDGSYRFDYETENRISQQESGQLRNAGSDQESIAVQGSYSYAGDDGQTYTVHYVADENGFRATGDHLPTPPPIPEAILRSLEITGAAASRSGYSGASSSHHQQPNRQYLSPPHQPAARRSQTASGYHY